MHFKKNYGGHVSKLYCDISLSNFDSTNQYYKEEAIALWDTGSNRSMISGRMAEKLYVEVTDREEALSLGGKNDYPLGMVDFILDGERITVIAGIDIYNDLYGIDAIIGMDIIGRGILTVDC